MLATIIGVTSGLLIIIVISILKNLDKQLIYGLILAGIGFLYVGFTWTVYWSFIITAIQAIFFVFFAYYGIKRSVYILAAGYFLHGCWDLAYQFIKEPGLIPPHYDLFCSTLDFTIGFYLLIFKQLLQKADRTSLYSI